MERSCVDELMERINFDDDASIFDSRICIPGFDWYVTLSKNEINYIQKDPFRFICEKLKVSKSDYIDWYVNCWSVNQSYPECCAIKKDGKKCTQWSHEEIGLKEWIQNKDKKFLCHVHLRLKNKKQAINNEQS